MAGISSPLELREVASPATPEAGTVSVFAQGGKVYRKDSAGTVTELAGGAASAPPALPSYAGNRSNPFDPTTSAYNWRETNTRQLQLSLLRAASQTGIANWVTIGDSVTSSSIGPAATYGYNHMDMWPAVMQRVLEQSGVQLGGDGVVALGNQPIGTTASLDPRLTFTGTWFNDANMLTSKAQNTSFTFTSSRRGTQIDLWYGNNSGPFTISIDGGAPVAPTRTGGASMTRYTVTGLADTRHTVTVVQTSTTDAYFQGVAVTGGNGLFVHNAAQYGSQANSWATTTNYLSGTWNKRVMAGTFPTDVVFIMLGINDITGSTYTPAQTTANIQAIRQKAEFTNSACVLILQHQTFNVSLANWEAFATAMYDLADSLDVPLIDLHHRYGPYATLHANGLDSSDGVHLTAVAQRDIGTLIAEQILDSTGASYEYLPADAPLFWVRAATTASITLSGTQTVDGVALAPNDAVLVKNQAAGSTNGVYLVKAAAWVRHPAFSRAEDTAAQLVRVIEGVQGGSVWSTNFKSTDILNTATMTWTQVGAGSGGGVSATLVDAKGDLLVATANDVLARLGVGTDGQVPIADSTQATGIRWGAPTGGGTAIAALAASTGNLSLSGLAAIDGVTPVAGDVILVKDQTAPAQNGVYSASAGAWSRHASWDTAAEVAAAGSIRVLSGTVNGGSIYMTNFKSTDTLGTTAMVWAEAYSDINPPGTLNLTETASPAVGVPVNGQSTLYTPDGVALRMKGDDGLTRPVTSPAAQMLPTGFYRANMSWNAGLGNGLAALLSGRLSLVKVWLEQGEVVTNLAFMTGSTAGASMTHWWYALYTAGLTLCGQTADQLTAAMAAATLYPKALTAPYTAPSTGYYYAGIMVAATTVPNLAGVSTTAPINAIPLITSGTSTTGLLASAPATAAALTAVGQTPLVLVS